MRSQVKGLNRASLNTQDGISLIETAEGYLSNISSLLQRIRELSVQSANGIYSNEDRLHIQIEVSTLIDEIDKVASHAQFKGMDILNGKFSNAIEGEQLFGSIWFHIGSNMNQREKVFINTSNSKALGLRDFFSNEILSISSINNANYAISKIDDALSNINRQRGNLGAYHNRLFYTVKGLMISSENVQKAESVIRDSDMAKEVVEYFKNFILTTSTFTLFNYDRVVKHDNLMFIMSSGKID